MAIIRKTLRTYRFIDKDPAIDRMRTILQDEGLFKRLKDVADLANLSPVTLQNLFHGDTRRPQHATVMGIITAVGYEQKFVKSRELKIDDELVFAKAWNKKERLRLEKAREPKRKKA